MHRAKYLSYAGSISPPSIHLETVNPNHNQHDPCHSSRSSLRVGKIGDVSAIVKMAPSTIRAKVRTGEFPAPSRLSYKLALWNLCEVERWFISKVNVGGDVAGVTAEVVNG